MGGLAKAMPWTAAGFLVGSVAICGLPPLNGFISEFLIYLSMFQLLGGDNASFAGGTLAAAALALVGTLAVACFVKAYGAVFLGVARSQPARQARESGLPMITALAVLATCCCAIGVGPLLVSGVFDKAVAAWAPNLPEAAPRLATLAPLDWLTTMAAVLIAGLVSGRLLLEVLLRHGGMTRSVTWGCGYSAATPRVQYTSSSFAQMLVGLFSWALRPQVHKPRNLPLFPRTADFHSEVGDVVLDEAVLPSFNFTGRQFSRFRVFQQGNIQTYLLYIFIALIVLLLWR
jgi:hydrogenase-4 component B